MSAIVSGNDDMGFRLDKVTDQSCFPTCLKPREDEAAMGAVGTTCPSVELFRCLNVGLCIEADGFIGGQCSLAIDVRR